MHVHHVCARFLSVDSHEGDLNSYALSALHEVRVDERAIDGIVGLRVKATPRLGLSETCRDGLRRRERRGVIHRRHGQRFEVEALFRFC